MLYNLEQLYKLPPDEQEKIALDLLRNINEEVQDDFLTPEQEQELKTALDDVEKGNYVGYSTEEVKRMLQDKSSKR